MKTILVPTEQNDVMDSALQTALLLARKFDSYIEGFALRFAITDAVAMDVASTMPLATFERESQEAAKQARGLFETFMRKNNVPLGTGNKGVLSFGWLEDALEGDYFVGSYGRVFDVTVLGRPSSDPRGPHMSTLEASLFESGRPSLIAPPSPPAVLGENILVAWNCSTEQARATAFAMPLLQQANRVTVLTVEGATVPGPTGEQIARYLQFNGVSATAATQRAQGRGGGEVILAYAAAQGCDLIVKGAYTQSRLRQMIFGGTTRHILANATLPVFTAH
ncbi:MAG: universal stress protein [Bradyrhizobiaceae bacterium]|nr:universal stress protein [Bradyrhizobiaceae bacterium]